MAVSKTSPVITIAIIALGFIAGYFYYSQALQNPPPPVQPINISADDSLAKFKDLKFNFSILDDEKFKALKILGESPVQPGVKGKTDLFAPF